MGGGKSGDTEETGSNDNPIIASCPNFSQALGGGEACSSKKKLCHCLW